MSNNNGKNNIGERVARLESDMAVVKKVASWVIAPIVTFLVIACMWAAISAIKGEQGIAGPGGVAIEVVP